ncbi:winged helix-turn-helix domain-containing protein [Oceanicella sp. SM1341]|uniref:ATP-binding protein n=1 Tax=Oceanicella sp. SM1341 TaxID=1548889 RepID=UPI000E5223C0|nr:winged helix-turn-helix domain-containing protein [Oceanicella sp. SM1341]
MRPRPAPGRATVSRGLPRRPPRCGNETFVLYFASRPGYPERRSTRIARRERACRSVGPRAETPCRGGAPLSSQRPVLSERPLRTPEGILAFGPFCLDVPRRQLLCGDQDRALGERAFDLLLALLWQPGELVSKERLYEAAWPDTVVEESNLRAQVALLRKALGDGRDGARYIVAVPGRGYRFVAPVERRYRLPPVAPVPAAAPALAPACLPGASPRLTRPIGRDEVIGALAARVLRTRFVTIVGPGGIGKTTVAMAVAAELAGACRDGACFLDLAPLASPELLPSALAAALSLSGIGEDPTPAILEELRGRHMLLVLDCCEHVIEPAALLAESLMRHAPGVSVLATSREPLRAEGESVHRLAPLEVPPAGAGDTAAEALLYPAVQLFVERAAAGVEGFALDDADAPAATGICRTLDGLALAIELAAARVDALGVRGLAARLDDRFAVLTQGRRTARQRHRTLGAVLDWSFDLLPPAEQLLLNRLSVFRAAFDIDAAVAVAGDPPLNGLKVFEGLANLVSKSLVVANMIEGQAEYRLSDSTRIYARAKLAASGEQDALARSHARHFSAVLTAREGGRQRVQGEAGLAQLQAGLDDVRAALDWAHGPNGDPGLAADIAAAAVPLWLGMSLLEECRQQVARALGISATGEQPELHMKLCVAYGLSLIYTRGPGPEAEAALDKALRLAEGLGDNDHLLRALWGLAAVHGGTGRFPLAMANARAFVEMAETPCDRMVGDRLVGMVQHYLGAQQEARPPLERLLTAAEGPGRGADAIRFQYDQRVAAGSGLAWVSWLLGSPDTARRHAHEALAHARAISHVNSEIFALAEGCCPIALLTGDMAALAVAVEALEGADRGCSVPIWSATGQVFRGLLSVRRGRYGQGIAEMTAGLESRRRYGFVARDGFYRAGLAAALAGAGALELAGAEIETALAVAAQHGERWCRPELLRVKGEILLAAGDPGGARHSWGLALETARADAAIGWELRIAICLARQLRAANRPVEARAMLAPLLARFSEGSDTADLRDARRLLATGG